MLSSHWPDVRGDYVSQSCYAEPLAFYATCVSSFDVNAQCSVLHSGDNAGNTAIINKGYSTKPGQVAWSSSLASDRC